MERGAQDQGKGLPEDFALGLRVRFRLFLCERAVSGQKASCGSRGTVLSTADAGKDQQIFTL